MNKESSISHLVQRRESRDKDRDTPVVEERREEEVLRVDK